MALPKVRSTNDIAAATKAPAITAAQSMEERTFASTPVATTAISGSPDKLAMINLRLDNRHRPSAQAEEGQDGHDHDDKADEIDDAIHVGISTDLNGTWRKCDEERKSSVAAPLGLREPASSPGFIPWNGSTAATRLGGSGGFDRHAADGSAPCRSPA